MLPGEGITERRGIRAGTTEDAEKPGTARSRCPTEGELFQENPERIGGCSL
jgi:hypothetical protein